MKTPSFILTTSPFELATVPLASLVFDRRSPNTDVFIQYEVVPTDYSRTVDINIQATVIINSKTAFGVLFSQLVSTIFRKSRETDLYVTADEAYMYTLLQPKQVFRDMLNDREQGENLKRVLEQSLQKGESIWLVVGLRTLVNAKLSNHKRNESHGGALVTASFTSATGDTPGALNTGAHVERSVMEESGVEMETPKERIYAICYRKLKVRSIRVDGRAGTRKVTAELESDHVWKAFTEIMGDEDATKEYIEADIEDEADMEGYDIIKLEDDAGHGYETFGFEKSTGLNT